MSKRTNDYETILNLSKITNNKLRKINDNRYDQIINSKIIDYFIYTSKPYI